MPAPSLVDHIIDLERRLAHLEAVGASAMSRGTVVSYNRGGHTATVLVNGVTGAGVPVSHTVEWWQVAAGMSCAVWRWSPDTPTNAVVVFTWGGAVLRNPYFDPSYGHRHRGLEDDAPSLT